MWNKLAARVIVTSTLLSLTLAPQALAQEGTAPSLPESTVPAPPESTVPALPPTGTASVTAYQIARSLSALSFGDVGSSILSEAIGITRNTAGLAPFHNMSYRCLLHLREAGGTALAQGECVQNDADGDQVFMTLEDQGGSGTLRLIGGTGKYEGIQAETTYTTQLLPSLDEGEQPSVIEYQVIWQLQ